MVSRNFRLEKYLKKMAVRLFLGGLKFFVLLKYIPFLFLIQKNEIYI